jgi:hypothetical protein
LPHHGRLTLDIGDMHLDHVANRDKADQLTSFNHGHVAEPGTVISNISRSIVSASRAETTLLVM